MTSKTMRAVVLSAAREISVQDKRIPTVQNGGDVIVRVHLAGLCGMSRWLPGALS